MRQHRTFGHTHGVTQVTADTTKLVADQEAINNATSATAKNEARAEFAQDTWQLAVDSGTTSQTHGLTADSWHEFVGADNVGLNADLDAAGQDLIVSFEDVGTYIVPLTLI